MVLASDCAPHEHDDFFGELRKVHRGLPGGIRAANHVNRFTFAGHGFGSSPP